MCVHNLLLSCFFLSQKSAIFSVTCHQRNLFLRPPLPFFRILSWPGFFFQFLTVHRVWCVGIPEPDVGLLYIFLCATRTPAPQIWFRTHLHTHLNFEVIATADKLALFIIEIFWLFNQYCCTRDKKPGGGQIINPPVHDQHLQNRSFCFVCLFLTEEVWSHGGLRTRELGQTPSHVSMGD